MKAVDPACGSGAFLLGVMQEILALNDSLFRPDTRGESLPAEAGHHQQQFHGADKDALAVSTAMLRLWLSLAVDYDGDGVPAPLPNLGSEAGDWRPPSPGPDPQQLDFTLQGIVNSGLRENIAGYTTAQGQRKATLKQEIADTKQQLRDSMGDAAPDGVVEWRIDFADVTLNGGFDVVIANPPYGITVKDRRSAVIGHTDSYTNFMGLAVDLAPTGLMAYITPTSWETGERFKKFRQYLFGKMALQSVVNLPYDVFETPYVDTAITIGSIGKPPPAELRLATLDKRADLDLTHIADYMTEVDWSAVAGTPACGCRCWMGCEIVWTCGGQSNAFGQDYFVKTRHRGVSIRHFEQPGPDAMPFFAGQIQRYEVQPSSSDNYVAVSDRESPYHKGLRIGRDEL